MSLLDRLRPDSQDAATPRRPVGPLGAALTGAWAAALTLLAVALPVLLAWAASSDTRATWAQAVRVAMDGWLLLHHVELTVPGGSVSVAPLGLSAVPAAGCWFAGRRVAAGHLDHDLVPGVRSGGAPPLRTLVAPLAAMAGGYTVVLTGAALLARGDGVRPVVWQAVIAGVLLATAVGGTSAVRCGRLFPAAVVADALRLPARLRRCARPTAMAVAAILALASLVLTGSLLARHSEVLALQHALDPGVVGGAVLTLAQVGIVPNLVLYAVAWLAGPGFAVGVGTSLTPGGSTLTLPPLVPVLGALPPAGALPAAGWLIVAAPVLVAAAAGWFVAARQHPATARVRDVLVDAVTVAVLAAGVLAVALAAAGGSAGPGLLAAAGGSAWKVGLALAAELTAGAAAGAWLTHRRRAP